MSEPKPDIIQHIEARTGLTLAAGEEPEYVKRYDGRNQYVYRQQQLLALNLRANQLDNGQLDWLDDPRLQQLQALNLSENQLTQLRLPASLISLQWLDLSENQKLTRLEWAGPLPGLQVLDLNECALEEVHLPAGMLALKKLDLSRNKQLHYLHLGGDCPALQELDLSENRLQHLHLPVGFQQLRFLYLNDNQLKGLEFAQVLPRLQTLHLRNNQLRHLPAHLLQYQALEALYLYGNPLQDLPAEIIPSDEFQSSWEAVESYLRAQTKSEVQPLFQAKMVLIGNGEVGKTSIRLKLIDPKAPLPKKKERTQGLDLAVYRLKKLQPEYTGLQAPIDFELNVYDFGGQGKYREVQQLFCSRKCLYLFVTACDDEPEKEDYIGFEYWLSMVKACSYDPQEQQASPLIYVVNKADLGPLLVNEQHIHSMFPNVQPHFVKISCKTQPELAPLKQAIRQALRGLGEHLFRDAYPRHWLEVKDELARRRPQRHISWQEYLALCQDHQMDEAEARTWLDVLDRIGAVIHFGRHPQLKEWVILDPLWVKEAIYRVLDFKYIKNGLLLPEYAADIWPEPPYTDAIRARFLALMKAYQLCYEQQNNRGETEYVIPAMLDARQPRFPAHLQSPACRVRFDYQPFLPAGTVNKFMVYVQQAKRGFLPESMEVERKKMSPGQLPLEVRVYDNMMWKNNVLVHAPRLKAYAHLEEVWAEKQVYVTLYGEQPGELLEWIHHTLSTALEDFKATKYLSFLQLEAWVWYKEAWRKLRDLQELGVEFLQPLPPTPMDPIPQLIAQDRLGKALDSLQDRLPEPLKEEGILLQGRLARLESQERKGTLSREQAGVERNRIIDAVLALWHKLSEQQEPAESERGFEKTPPAPQAYSKPEDSPSPQMLPEGETAQAAHSRKILFLAANPTDLAWVQTGKELRILKAELERGKQRERYHFAQPRFAVTISELLRAVNERPYLLHFSGHAVKQGILITTDDNQAQLLPLPAIEELFRQLKGHTQVVVLNACYSAEQARVISKYGMYVVGNNLPVTDAAAISFSKGFYNGLGEGKEVMEALSDARVVLLTEHPQKAAIVEVWKDGKKII